MQPVAQLHQTKVFNIFTEKHGQMIISKMNLITEEIKELTGQRIVDRP